MTDLAIKQAERSGDTVRAMGLSLRAGLLKPEQLRLWAYVGLEAARELGDKPDLLLGVDQVGYDVGTCHLADWAAGLPALAPSYKVRERCDHCLGTGDEPTGQYRRGTPCTICDGTCDQPREIGQQHLAVTACIGVARRVFSTWTAALPHNERYMNGDGRAGSPVWLPRDPAVPNAIEAAERWCDDPTPENEEACRALLVRADAPAELGPETS